jgi:hypothetical protein
MAAGRPQGPVDPSVLSSVEIALRPVRRPGPAELIWCWRWEIGIPAAIAGLAWLIAAGPAGIPGLISAAGAGLAAGIALLCWPSTRRWITSRLWCIVTPHRIRTGCVYAWVQTRDGQLPIVIRTTPEPYGERVRLWLRPGITAADLSAASDTLAVACWAAAVRVIPDRRLAHRVTLEVIRNTAEERTGLTPDVWPAADRVEDGGLGDPGERDIVWPRREATGPF